MAEALPFRTSGADIVPDWLGPHDLRWVRAVVEHADRFIGRTWGEWQAERDVPLTTAAPARKRHLCATVLERNYLGAAEAGPVRPEVVRETVTRVAQRARSAGDFRREACLEEAAQSLGVEVGALEGLFLGDIPTERRLAWDAAPDPAQLLAECNLALVQALLRRALRVEIELDGRARAVVRQVLLRRLLCVPSARAEGFHLDITGVLSIFRRTTMYGSAFASIVPCLAWCDRFELRAELDSPAGPRHLALRTGDPFLPSRPPRHYDSKLEEQFARAFRRHAVDWELSREPEPVPVDGTLIFPDFAIWPRHAPGERWLVEIVGFWTPEYLHTKLERLRRAGRTDIVICVDARRGCADDSFPDGAPVVRFDRRVDPAEVLAAIAGRSARKIDVDVERIGLRDLFLDLAGRRPPDDAIHGRLAMLRPGASVAIQESGSYLAIVDESGGEIAAISAGARERWRPKLARVVRAKVAELVVRNRDQSGPAYRGRVLVDNWVVPIVDVELERSTDEASRRVDL